MGVSVDQEVEIIARGMNHCSGVNVEVSVD